MTEITTTDRREDVVAAKEALHQSMPEGHLCGCEFIADRLLDKGFVIRHVPSSDLVKWATTVYINEDDIGAT